MAKKDRSRGKGCYEIWPRRRDRAWMAGMGFYEECREYMMLPPAYHASECWLEYLGKVETFRPVRGGKKVRIFEGYLKNLGGELTVVVLDPLSVVRPCFLAAPGQRVDFPYNHKERRRAKKHTKAFLREFPQITSPAFNGALLFHDAMVKKGLEPTLAFQEGCVYRPQLK